MKKLILLLTIILGCTFAFAINSKKLLNNNSTENTIILINTLTKKVLSKSFGRCTVTVSIDWYDEYGNFLGTTTGTASYNNIDNTTAFNCAMAEHLATNIATDKKTELIDTP